MNPKVIGGILVALIVAIGAGWIWGAAGKSAIDQDRRRLEERADFESARAEILDGRTALFLNNFGDASKHFEAARMVLEHVQSALREVGQAERAGRVEIVLSNLKDAQRMAAQLDANAQNAAIAALDTLQAVRPSGS
jgi:hypothetical protein